MVKRAYQVQIDGKMFAKAMVKNKPVSTKYATELCREIKGMPLAKAEAYLKRIINQEDYLPLRKYRKKVAHRKGRAKSGVKSGRYPKKLAQIMLELLEQARNNAVNKGLDEDKLMIVHAFASYGFRRISHQPKGHIAGKVRKKKSTHIEIIVQEVQSL
jgi:large subunit ribosomal protein L22